MADEQMPDLSPLKKVEGIETLLSLVNEEVKLAAFLISGAEKIICSLESLSEAVANSQSLSSVQELIEEPLEILVHRNENLVKRLDELVMMNRSALLSDILLCAIGPTGPTGP
ncbi:hypothetical protein, partial [Pradoshia sp.]